MGSSLPRLLLCAGLGSLLFAGAASAQGEPEIKDLALGFGLDLPFAVHIVAIEKGWFGEEGFQEVTTKTFTAGALAGEALVAGEIHLWTPGNLPPVSMVHNAIPVVVLGVDSINLGLDKLVVRKDANVTGPEDLYDIKIGLLEGSTASLDLANLIDHYGLDPNRIQVVNLAPPEQFASLIAGDVQAILAWEPWPYRALQEADAEVVHTGLVSHFDANDGEQVQISHNRSIFVASEEFVRANPNTVDALMRVLMRASRYVADPANKEEVLKLFSDFQDQDIEVNRALWDNYVFDPTIDENYVADMEATAAFLEATGRIRDRMDVLEYTYTEPVAKVAPSLVEVEGRWQP
jgi:ABC-type nitrate/sulfonate/bicarbonate transport system substrate-binding protein